MSYLASIGTFKGAPPAIPGFPGSLPSFVPGPGSPNVPPMPGPSMPAGLFPTTAKVGDVVQATGPFANKIQGQVVVRFAGTRGIALSLTGPFGGSVVVPPEAESGACTIEVDGRQVFGTNCVISKGRSSPLPTAHAPRRGSWYNFGPTQSAIGEVAAPAAVGAVFVIGLLFFALGGDQ